MSIFKCSICGYVYDEESESVPFSQLEADYTCPVCKASKVKFEPAEGKRTPSPIKDNPLAYPDAFAKSDSKEFPQMDAIHQMALTGSSVVDAMGTLKPMISWDDILIMGAQLNPAPLNAGDPVDTKTVIGKKANGNISPHLCIPYVFRCLIQRVKNRTCKRQRHVQDRHVQRRRRNPSRRTAGSLQVHI